jgi:two-component system chemotaxis response regulator CheB
MGRGNASGTGPPVVWRVIRVLVVDDSAVVRRVLTEELGRFDDIEVVGTAVDPYVARDKIIELRPDVLTLDVEMPRMDGLSFLARLMKHYPMPVVVVSSLTPANSEMALRALELGAIEVVPKPGSVYSTPDVGRDLVRAIRAASVARLTNDNGEVHAPPPTARPLRTTDKVIAIGASTGGVKAVESVLKGLPADSPGTLIVQHMPVNFTGPFASRLDKQCPMQVREARDGDDLSPGLALIAPAGAHLVLARSGSRYVARVKDGPRVHYQRPSVDVLFGSVATAAGANAVGVLLTGMGSDGASGLLEMRHAGAHTIAEAESSCVVYGMPKVAAEIGAAAEVTPLPRVGGAILNALRKMEQQPRG